jgi:transposase
VEQDGRIRQDPAKAIQVQDGNPYDGCDPLESAQDSGEPKKRGSAQRHIGRTKGGLSSKLHAVCDDRGRPVRLLLTAGNINDIVGAGELLKDLPEANYLLADKGYDADWFREGLRRRGVEPCIPYISTRKIQQPYDVSLYKRRHKIENMFSKLKDWRPITTRYDRSAHIFLSSICIACSFLFYLGL